MTTVQTVLGPILSSRLGLTLMHEHVVVGPYGRQLDSTRRINWREMLQRAVDQLQEAKGFGLRSVVDATPIDLERNAAFLAEVAQASGVNIIMSTGMYCEASGIPHHFRSWTKEEFAELFVREIRTGVGESGIRAGVIKAATGGQQITPLEREVPNE